jgi:hypothetical protein
VAKNLHFLPLVPLALLTLAVGLLNPSAAFGKRLPTKPVAPVVHDGIEYSAHGEGKVGSVVATELSSGKSLWKVRVFRIHTHWWKGEEDNQWIFVSDMALVGSALIVKNERMRCYLLDLAQHVKRQPCH